MFFQILFLVTLNSKFVIGATVNLSEIENGAGNPDSGVGVYEPEEQSPPRTYKCSVRLYTQPEFQGRNYVQWTNYSGACVNIKRSFRKVAQSVDTYDICVVLWTKLKCRGRAIRLERYAYGTANLNLVNFTKVASSIQVCAGTDKKDPDSGPAPPEFKNR